MVSAMSGPIDPPETDRVFLEFRRKVRESEMLSAATERLLLALRFSGRLSVVVHNGRVLKSGYEEGYFTRKHDARLI
ncbi:MAG: hypothetical protein ACRD24_06185 [Terriglobales bacterium]